MMGYPVPYLFGTGNWSSGFSFKKLHSEGSIEHPQELELGKRDGLRLRANHVSANVVSRCGDSRDLGGCSKMPRKILSHDDKGATCLLLSRGSVWFQHSTKSSFEPFSQYVFQKYGSHYINHK